MAAKSRYTLLLSERSDRLLDELQDEFGKSTRAEVFDLAVTLLDWVRKELKEGHPVGSYNEKKDSFRELLMPMPQPMHQGAITTGEERPSTPQPHHEPA